MKTQISQCTILKKKCQYTPTKGRTSNHAKPYPRQINGEEISIYQALERYMSKYSL
ncbi:hypothetical protein SPACI_028320 [Sporomusa acidovorans DSM 3132]|uniref:Uncharacterized protein n=1 Tax=Sporomusa acidovorans (strain ATCC 49682 / DSM 3132 / Mol) TaxID=1123286 RepID=A0ABZ3J402_SPOA4|nr:hypothetical protein SPACI_26720 [Sporomusa acidovorans DSM 3132]SDD39612.1 hypothetical protein SAMN04488499_1001112 [Sporomusa acidovorans]